MQPPAESATTMHDTVGELLDATGYRYTRARRCIVEVLDAADAPLTIPQLLAADRRLVQSSTYRNVLLLEEAGALNRVVTADDHARFELDEQVTQHHHHHLICEDCGDVSDFELPAKVEQVLQKAFGRAGRAATFRIQRHRIDLLGTCAACA
ncbi:MAG: Fur family transcriptional regulator [Actinomycetota bacterium]